MNNTSVMEEWHHNVPDFLDFYGQFLLLGDMLPEPPRWLVFPLATQYPCGKPWFNMCRELKYVCARMRHLFYKHCGCSFFRLILFFPGSAGLHRSFEDHENKCWHNIISPGTALTILGILFAEISIKSLL